MDAVIKLITKTYSKNPLGYPIATETETEVLCDVGSISRAEYFNAGKAGLAPDFVFTINAIEYNGEGELDYNGKRYSIYRTYKADSDMMELYAEYKSGVSDANNN